MTEPQARAAVPVVQTERLVLRAFRESDLGPYTEILTTEPVRRSLHLPDDVDEYSAWDQIAAFTGQWQLRGTGQWAVEELATGRLVGRVGTHHPHRRDWPGVEIGWTFHPDVWGMGYASESGLAARDWAFASLEIDVLHSLILTDNTRSQAVAARLGFTLAETRTFAWYPPQPHGRWQLTRAQWDGRGDTQPPA